MRLLFIALRPPVPARTGNAVILSNYLRPRVAIVDPLLTLYCPAKLTADSGIDALTHAIESYTSLLSSPLSEGLALHAIRLLAGSIRYCFQNRFVFPPWRLRADL